MLTFLTGLAIGAVAGSVFGILFGRKNTQKVEKSLTEARSKYDNLVAEVKKKAGQG